jgi:hypothetical protein
MRGNCTPVGIECAVNLLIAAGADSRAHQNNQIQTAEHRLPQSKAFPYQALYPVAFRGASGSLY